MDRECIVLWDIYTKAFNELSDRMTAVGIEVDILRKVVEARANFEIQYARKTQVGDKQKRYSY